jgi:hypothetical protein
MANRSRPTGRLIETREQIARFFLIHAKDLDGAIGIAAPVPGACIGTIKVVPLKQFAGLPE